jgi:Asp-tRNA(Asn)/Glu-tRNA(Gln) amidotransferase B subunit
VGGAEGRIHGADRTLVDFNRAGTPLVEIVTGPTSTRRTTRSASCSCCGRRRRARHLGRGDGEGLAALRRQRLGAAEGSDELRTRTELKNMNSFNFAAKGIEREIARRSRSTSRAAGRAGDAALRPGNESAPPLRSKEEAQDYRYFPSRTSSRSSRRASSSRSSARSCRSCRRQDRTGSARRSDSSSRKGSSSSGRDGLFERVGGDRKAASRTSS